MSHLEKFKKNLFGPIGCNYLPSAHNPSTLWALSPSQHRSLPPFFSHIFSRPSGTLPHPLPHPHECPGLLFPSSSSTPDCVTTPTYCWQRAYPCHIVIKLFLKTKSLQVVPMLPRSQFCFSNCNCCLLSWGGGESKEKAVSPNCLVRKVMEQDEGSAAVIQVHSFL